MKLFNRMTIGAVMAVVAMGAAALFTLNQARAADVIGIPGTPGNPVLVLTSAGSNTNLLANACTNGVWPKSIAHDVSITNWTSIPVAAGADSLSLQFNAGGGATTAAVFTVYCSVQPPRIANNSSTGNNTNGANAQIFDTVTLAVALGSVGVTNKSYTLSTTPVKGAMPYFYIYSIGSGVGTASYITNYSVWACSQ